MAQNNYGTAGQGRFGLSTFKYDVDIVLCIDATKSMLPIIQLVKDNALHLPDDIIAKAKEEDRVIDSLRIKILLFRDYLADGQHAMETTDFMRMPDQKEMFQKIVSGIIADGGGDEPEDGLEALAYAMASDWQKPAPQKKRRQLIVVWTDASTHKLGFGRTSENYDPNMPKTFGELTEWWGDDENSPNAKMHYSSKRLLLFAPKSPYWTTIRDNWDNVILSPTIPGQGLSEQNYDTIINLLVYSLGGK